MTAVMSHIRTFIFLQATVLNQNPPINLITTTNWFRRCDCISEILFVLFNIHKAALAVTGGCAFFGDWCSKPFSSKCGRALTVPMTSVSNPIQQCWSNWTFAIASLPAPCHGSSLTLLENVLQGPTANQTFKRLILWIEWNSFDGKLSNERLGSFLLFITNVV